MKKSSLLNYANISMSYSTNGPLISRLRQLSTNKLICNINFENENKYLLKITKEQSNVDHIKQIKKRYLKSITLSGFYSKYQILQKKLIRNNNFCNLLHKLKSLHKTMFVNYGSVS